MRKKYAMRDRFNLTKIETSDACIGLGSDAISSDQLIEICMAHLTTHSELQGVDSQ